MGEQDVNEDMDAPALRTFTQALLRDVRALEQMLDANDGMIERGKRRIGAEQEMFLIDPSQRPAPLAMDSLKAINDDRFTTELARFNLEANLPAYEFGGGCLSQMEADLEDILARARAGVRSCGGDVVLTGILPTLRLEDLGLDNMTPVPRYFALNHAMVRMAGGEFQTRIKGIDELYCKHDNVMLEACNTSFQVHFQVGPDEFAPLYNLAQAVTAPVLAAAVNSPVLLGRRLWQETRMALFQQSIDSRSEAHQARGHRTRVRFGDSWVKKSVVEIFREDIARFRVVLATEVAEDPLAMVARGEAPPLDALRLHNGTVYRWNRACYGVNKGVAHLRIENRVIPAGPTLIDEVANSAFFFGLMAELATRYPDITEVMAFDDAHANFLAAARIGLKAQLTWTEGREIPAAELILEELLPAAHSGLLGAGIDVADIERYLGVIRARVESGRTGSQWALASIASMAGKGTPYARSRALTAAMVREQEAGHPVHAWPLAHLDETTNWRDSYRTVGQYMTSDPLTVHPSDLVDLAASLMDWERIRYVPVEDDDGRLVGVVSHRTLLRLVGQGDGRAPSEPVAIRAIMTPDPISVRPDTPTIEAIALMRNKRVGCLPVVEERRLVGLITQYDFIDIAAKLLTDELSPDGSA